MPLVLTLLRTEPSPTERCISFPRRRHPQLHSTGVVEAAVVRGEEGEEEAEVRGRAGVPVRHGSKSRPRPNPATPPGSHLQAPPRSSPAPSRRPPARPPAARRRASARTCRSSSRPGGPAPPPPASRAAARAAWLLPAGPALSRRAATASTPPPPPGMSRRGSRGRGGGGREAGSPSCAGPLLQRPSPGARGRPGPLELTAAGPGAPAPDARLLPCSSSAGEPLRCAAPPIPCTSSVGERRRLPYSSSTGERWRTPRASSSSAPSIAGSGGERQQC